MDLIRWAKVLISCCLLLVLASCHTDNTLQGFDYNFLNLTDKPINIRIYTTLNDYTNHTHVFMQGRINTKQYYYIPVGKFVVGSTYYVDWYSDDYLYNNWYWSNITLRNAFSPSEADYEFLINTVEWPDPSRRIWMKDSLLQTIWIANDAYNYSGGVYSSIWAGLPWTLQNVSLTLNRDFSAHLKLINSSSQTIDSVLTYKANFDSVQKLSVVSLYNTMDSLVGTVTGNFNASGNNFSGPDNLALAYIKTMGYYQLVRQ
jgi:hypothetical protein